MARKEEKTKRGNKTSALKGKSSGKNELVLQLCQKMSIGRTIAEDGRKQ
ncbi:MAG: hypothetical protein VZR28_10930 [Candidatus Cryptobacteroides sp.]|nr:hypothetical protein [Candidatus Cryptobacteroides sp.]